MKGAEKKKKVTIVLFSGEMDRALAACNIAIGARSMGMDAVIFFTFWGLNFLRKEKPSPKGKNFLQKMMAWMNRGGRRKAPLSRFNMAGLGPLLMGILMKNQNMLSLEESFKTAKEMGVKMVACTITMGVMGLTEEDLEEELVDSYAGVATYLSEADESSITLFI